MLRLRRALAQVASASILVTTATAASAGHPDGASLVRLLGRNAGLALSTTRSTSTLEGLVRLPPHTTAEALGLAPVVDGYGRLRGGAPAILAFEAAHPEVRVEISPPLHSLLDK